MSYTFVINSKDKLTGNNNSGSYNVNFRILPDDVQFYEMTFAFYSTAGFYRDTISAGNLITNTNANGYITTNLPCARCITSNGSPMNVLGTFVRQVDPTGNASHPNITYLYADCATNCQKVYLKPQVESVQIQIYNTYTNSLFLDTDHAGANLADMSAWTLTIYLTPVKEKLPSP